MIKILHVLGALNRGGVESWLMHVLRHIDRSAFQLDFCCLSGEEGVYAPEAKTLGSQVFTIKLTKNLPAFNRQFGQLLRERQYDVVHSHVHHFSGYILRLSSKLGIPVRIAHSHSAPPNSDLHLSRQMYLWQMQKWIKRFATRGFGVSGEAMCSLFGRDWKKDQRWQLLYCGINLDLFERDDRSSSMIRSQYKIPITAKVIGHVGRFTEAKNHQFLLEIAETINSINKDVWFLLVGDGSTRVRYEDMVRHKNIPRVVFAGVQSDVSSFLSAMDLFLFPSLWEGLPLAVVEAQAVGLPCLCSDAVTAEMVVTPESVQFLSLDSPVNEWIEKSFAMLSAPRLSPHTAWQAVADSPFSIVRNVQELTHFYIDGITHR